MSRMYFPSQPHLPSTEIYCSVRSQLPLTLSSLAEAVPIILQSHKVWLSAGLPAIMKSRPRLQQHSFYVSVDCSGNHESIVCSAFAASLHLFSFVAIKCHGSIICSAFAASLPLFSCFASKCHGSIVCLAIALGLHPFSSVVIRLSRKHRLSCNDCNHIKSGSCIQGRLPGTTFVCNLNISDTLAALVTNRVR